MATKRKRKTAAKKSATKKSATKAAKRRTQTARRKPAAGRGAARRTKNAPARRTKKAPARRAQKTPVVAAKNATSDEMKFLRRYASALSKTTQRAKWVHSPDEHEDQAGQSLATRRHEVIQHWAEERRARPATVSRTEHDGRPGVLRFNFPGFGQGGRLQEIGWKDWFRSFDDRELVFLFQEHKRDGRQSNFFRFDSPRRERA